MPSQALISYLEGALIALSVLELVMLNSLLTEYNFKQHVASDIEIDEQYVPASSLETQNIHCLA